MPQAAYSASTALCVTDRPAFTLTTAETHTHGLWPAAIWPYVATVYRFNGLHPSSAVTHGLHGLLLNYRPQIQKSKKVKPERYDCGS